MDAPFAQSRELTWFTAIGRLKPGVTLARARANLANVQANLARQYPKTDAEIRPLIDPLKEATSAEQGSPVDPVRLGLAAAADRVHQYRGAVALAGHRAAA